MDDCSLQIQHGRLTWNGTGNQSGVCEQVSGEEDFSETLRRRVKLVRLDAVRLDGFAGGDALEKGTTARALTSSHVRRHSEQRSRFLRPKLVACSPEVGQYRFRFRFFHCRGKVPYGVV